MLAKINFFIILFLYSIASSGSDDSTGVILKNGKVFILHKVENGQGLYGVARRYKTFWTKVRDANPGSESNIMPGQILYVPTDKTEKQFFGNKTPLYSKNAGEYTKPVIKKTSEKEKTPETPDVNKSPKTTFTVFYTVKKGETLFSIAKKFSTTADFLKQLNKMSNYSVSVGKDILVPMTAEIVIADSIIAQKESEVKKVQKELDEITAKIEAEKKRENDKIDSLNKTTKEKPEKDVVIKKDSIKSEVATKPNNTTPEYTVNIENIPEYEVEKVTETGQGKVMSDITINQSKDWVIHHSAPEGTALQITNPSNNKSIYVKVVKNFSRTENDPLIIYITKNTADYLEVSKKEKFAIKVIFAK